jgi:aminoglycoside phosphotransferase family enzyme/predicted kinase
VSGEPQGPATGLAADLARPEAFPPPRPRSVEQATTHGSWVFLTETEVWKVKRPVNFGFLDYSDPAKRRRCCEEEVRLGSRLAPGVYLGVVPVYRTPGGFSFAGPGAIVDHAVRMTRLDDATSARSLLRAGRLEPEHLARLAARLAEFYAAAESVPELGEPAVLAEHLAGNLAQTEPYAGRFVEGRRLAELYRWQVATLDSVTELLRERVAGGRIRDGHGDLRLEHVYYPAGPSGRPIVIDPIEFNRSLRCQDVALDASFAAMELEDQGRPDLAAFFISRFARDSNDYGFYPALDLFLSYRAWVRAKVACFVAADPTTPRDKVERKAGEARRLYELAGSYAEPRRRTRHVVAVGGMIATGKSTIADALSLELETAVVSSDATRKGLRGLRPAERGGPELYTDEMDRQTYAQLVRSARSVLASGRGVILDATFRRPAARALARELAREHGREFLFVEVACDEETIRARLRERGREASVSDAREEQLERVRAGYEPPAELPADEVAKVDGGEPVAATVRALSRRLSG